MNTAPVKKIAAVLGTGSLLLGGLVMAPSATAATPTTTATTTAPAASTPDASGPTAGLRTSLVAAWYQNFLGRSSAGDPGAQYWVVRLRTDAPDVVLADLLRTPEHAGKQVDDLYTSFLGRGIEGDPYADYWIGGLQRGDFPAEWVEQNILGSAEYQQRASSSDPQRAPQLVVARWYRDVLGRDASAGEIGYWSIQFEDQSNLDVLRDIWYSSEAVALRVATHYGDYLRRTASSAEIGYWSAAEARSDVGVVIAIASSQEYQTNALTRGVAG